MLNIIEESWDYTKANTKYFTHCFHTYPAIMIPQVAHRLIEMYGPKNGNGILFDPFCGTGTTLVEGILKGLKVIGTDINPLATLIAKVKCQPISPSSLRREIIEVYNRCEDDGQMNKKQNNPSFKNIEFWFTPSVISKLSSIGETISLVKDVRTRRFLQVAFSETIRSVSLTKPSEFKLVRRSENNRATFNPDVLGIFKQKVERNYKGLEYLINELKEKNITPNYRVFQFNTVEGIPQEILKPKEVDIVITSPPYGDSSTTVAYGQYSRLSNQWLGFADAFSIDKMLMGGTAYDKNGRFDIIPLDSALRYIESKNSKRAMTISSFYKDLENSTRNVARVVKLFGYACYVVSNRKVQGISLPTNVVIIEFLHKFGFEEVGLYERKIPNKRMPLKNSPTNVVGKTMETMTKEFIVVMQKRRHID